MSPPPTARVLVIRRRYIGDLVLITPMLANLRLYWPDAEITVLVDEGYQAILRLNPYINRVLTIPRKGSGLLVRNFQLVRELRRLHFTHVFDLDTNDRTALLTWLTGAGFRASYFSDKHRWRRRQMYNHLQEVAVDEYNARSIIDYYLRLLPLAHIPVISRECRLEPPADLLANAQAAYAPRPPGRRILLHPGSRSTYRIWPLERFARVMEKAQSHLGAHFFLTGGPGDRELIEGIQSHLRHPVPVLPASDDVCQFAAYARAADLFLCHDSGPMHVAAAVGTRVVALFSAQSTTLWHPVGTGHQLLQAPMPCTACVRPGECDPNNGYKSYCVRRISEDEVLAAIRSVFSAPHRN